MIVRLSDFKSNEYANLIGGARYEPHEENPMIGFRGASRYVDPSFKDCFALECQALKKVRNEMGLTNAWAMIPFVRTLDEGRKVIDVLAENGIRRGEDNLKIIMMCELPSNALLADEFLDIFDGFSIGSNDLTQLTLGLDRDSAIVAHLFDERDAAVKKLLVDGHQGGQGERQVHRHLRSGSVGSSGSGRMADAAGHRIGVAESGYGRGYVADAGEEKNRLTFAK